jgi:predicted signal transduction protein with EAL and GGDEF domain
VTQSHSEDNKKTIFQRADKALYKTKNSGRNQVILEKTKNILLKLINFQNKIRKTAIVEVSFIDTQNN